MSELSLVQTPAQLLAFIKEDMNRKGNLSVRGVARCCGVADKSIINSGSFNSAKLAGALAEHGFEAGSLVRDGFPPQAVWTTIEYFAYESKAKAPIAKQLARTFGSVGIMTTLEQLQESKSFPESAIGHVEKDPIAEGISHIAIAIDHIFGGTKMNPNLIAGIKTEAISANYPQYRPALEAAKKQLFLPLEQKLLSATELAVVWRERTGESLSEIAMNRKLQSANLQKPTGGKNPSWEAIGRGIDHSQLVADTARGHAKTIQTLKWYESVLEML